MKSDSLLLLVPELYGAYGGVQQYMCRLAEILSAYAAASALSLDCVSLADSSIRAGRHSHAVAYRSFQAAAGSKVRFTRAAAAVAVRHRPDIIVVGHVGLAPAALALCLGMLARRYVVVLHGREAWKRHNLLDRLAAGRACRLVATTRYTGDEFTNLNGTPAERVRTIPLAIPDTHSTPVPPGAGVRRAALRVLTAGRLVTGARYKGIDTLIEASGRVLSAGVPTELTVVGDGDDRPRLEALASRCGVRERVHFTGVISNEELSGLYRDCDVFAMPSRREGFGIVFLEAMRFGKPCIGGKHGGTPEVIEDGVDGYLVEHGDIDDLAGRLLDFARRPQLVRRMGERAREKVERSFRFEHMRCNWFHLLDELRGATRPDAATAAIPAATGGEQR